MQYDRCKIYESVKAPKTEDSNLHNKKENICTSISRYNQNGPSILISCLSDKER